MRRGKQILSVLLAAVMLSGCAYGDQNGTNGTQSESQPQITGFTAASPGAYDSEDTAIVVKKDTEAKTISFRNLATGKQYTLTYDGTTVLYDKNNQAMSMEQVEIGDLVEVRFLKTKKTLTSLQESPDAFVFQAVKDFEISESGRSMTINGTQYRLAEDLAVVSGGEVGSLMDINAADTLIVKGFDFDVHSIVIDKGHGYLRLMNDESFIGGWIEVGSELIVPITENMLLTVPEGTYNVSVSCGGSGGTKSVTIYPNEEQSMDVGDLVTEIKEGSVLFDVTPSTASVYVDGQKIDPSEAVVLTYGLHQVIVKADGYVTLTKYVRVGQSMATLTMEMEKSSEAEDENQDGNETEEASGSEAENQDEEGTENGSEVSGEDVVTPGDGTVYYVTINAPADAEVYVDGTYVGLAPVRFQKTEGSHEITLRRSGYQTRSYTIEVDGQEKDIAYTFSELQPISE